MTLLLLFPDNSGPPPDVTGSSAVTASPATGIAAGTLTFRGASAVTASPASGSAAGTLSFRGASAAVGIPGTTSAAGTIAFIGNSALSATPATSAAGATLSFIGSSNLLATLPSTAGTGTVQSLEEPQPEDSAVMPSGGGYWNFFVRPLRRMRLVLPVAPEPPLPPAPIAGRGTATIAAIEAYGFGVVLNPKPVAGRAASVQPPAETEARGYASKGRREAELELLTLLFDHED